jgi:hypothetical protein
MPDYAVIADVSSTLTARLTDAMSALVPPPLVQLHNLVGAIPTDPPLLTVFLYEIVEDATSKNRPRITRNAPPNVALRKPPLALVLKYLITPWSNDRLTDQQMLGRSMQELYDNAILTGPTLGGGLSGTAESLKVTLAPLTLEERTRVWHAVQQPYRVSLSYEVRVANLDSDLERLVRPVSNRILDAALPELTT